MRDARARLLDQIVADVGAHGLGDRSLRDLALAVGSSHRMLIYHFGSRAGLVQALVGVVEQAQRDLLDTLAMELEDPAAVVLALWAQVSAPELRPFVRLFFECVAATGGTGLTEPWLEAGTAAARRLDADVDLVDLRLGVALTRGLLIDVLASGDAAPATAALERYVARHHGGAP